MIVSNNGYLKLNDVLELKNKGTDFSIYETHKKTNVLVTECFNDTISMYRPKPDNTTLNVCYYDSSYLSYISWCYIF